MKASKIPATLPSWEELLDKFEYDDVQGLLIRKTLDRKYFRSDKACSMYNSKFAGEYAGTLKSNGYVEVRIGHEHGMRKAHRVIYKWVTGEEPGLELDHKDGVRSNNRFENLRNCEEFGINTLNAQMYKTNKTGTTGVYQLPSGNWLAGGCFQGEQQWLGTYPTQEEAAQVRQAWQDSLGFSHRHGK